MPVLVGAPPTGSPPVRARSPAERYAALVKIHADALRPQWKKLEETSGAWVSQLLAFSLDYGERYKHVKSRGGNNAVKQLNADIGLTDSVASRIRDIAEVHPQLAPHARLLPTSIDAIHSLAVLAKDEPAKFAKAIAEGTITPSLTVRDARELQPARRAPTLQRTKPLVIQVTFESRPTFPPLGGSTALLKSWCGGDREALDRLMPLVRDGA